jgi:hypothetical protein
LGQSNGLALGAGETQPYFFLPKVTSGYGFSGSVGRWVGGNFSVELGGFVSFLNSEITLDQNSYQRTYLSGNGSPNLTAYGADFRFLYELPIPSQFKISPFVGINYEGVQMSNVLIDKTVSAQAMTVAYNIPSPDENFGSYNLEAGLYLGFDLDEHFQLYTSAQLPVASLVSSNFKYPPHVVSSNGSTSELDCNYQSFTFGLKVTFDTQTGAEE